MISSNWMELSPLGIAIGWTIVHSFWQIGILAILLKLALRIIPGWKSNLRYSVASIALLLALVWSVSTFTKQWSDHAQDRSIAESIQDTSSKINSENGVLLKTKTYSIKQVLKTKLESIMPFITFAWLLGILISCVYLVSGLFHLDTLYKKGTTAPGKDWEEKLQCLCQQMNIKHKVKLLLSNRTADPITFQFFTSVILLPVSMMSHLSTAQIEILLLHELAHIKRHDFLINIFQSLIDTLFFYHPAAWWISDKIREEREHCCDDLALQVQNDPQLYAETLTRIQVQHFSLKKRLAMSANTKKGKLTKRIFRLFGQYDQQKSVLNNLLLVVLLACFFSTQAVFVVAQSSSSAPKLEIKTTNDTLPLMVVDGVVIGKYKKTKMDGILQPEDIESINVIKGLQAEVKYGADAIGGVVEIWTKKWKGKIPKQEGKQEKEKGKKKSSIHLKQDLNETLTKDIEIQLKNPLVIFNDEVLGIKTVEEIHQLAPAEEIQTINVRDDSAVKEYGYEDADGIIEIWTKKSTGKIDQQEIKLKKEEEAQLSIQLEQTSEENSQKEIEHQVKSPLIVLDGEVLGKKSTDEIKELVPVDQIQEMNVLKDESALKKYGQDGVNGVIEIWTKKGKKDKPTLHIKPKAKKKDEAIKINDKKPLMVIDGEIVGRKSGEEIDALIPKQPIEEIGVFKGAEAVEKYGEEGADGVVEIWTKQNPLKVYPNPSDGEVTIEFELTSNTKVQINILSADSKVIGTILNEKRSAGTHKVTWQPSQGQKGIFIVQLGIKKGSFAQRVVIE